jgi:hypothetical protein
MNALYSSADCIYFCNAALYILCSLREEGFFTSFYIFGALARALGRARPAPDAEKSMPRAAAEGAAGDGAPARDGAAGDCVLAHTEDAAGAGAQMLDEGAAGGETTVRVGVRQPVVTVLDSAEGTDEVAH